jgi:polygalacturonase
MATATRRAVLAAGAAIAPALAALSARADADAWAQVPAILARIRPPRFAKRDFPITDHGADQAADCTQAFAKAIAACHEAGGGRVVVPAGTWATGAIHLKSNVNLHISKDATIAFSRDPKAYLPLVMTRWEGIELMNYSPFIYALDQENIAITGEGTIDGRADNEHWWPWKGLAPFGWREGMPNQAQARAKLFAMAENNTPVAERIFGEGSYLRPMFIQPYRCKNVLIEGVHLLGSPMWQIHPVLCANLTVRGLTVTASGPNTDGCDPESCRDVLIEGVTFSTGDDCIAINSGRNADGRRLHTPSENIVIRGCHMKNGHGALTVGSQISGGVRNVFAEDCRMDSPILECAIRVKNNALRGGVLENLYFRRIAVGQVSKAVVTVDYNYEEGPNGPFQPVLRNMVVEHVVSAKSTRALDIQGFASAPIEGVVLRDCEFNHVAEPSIVKFAPGLRMERVTVNGARVT